MPFSIDFDRRPYNTLALPCECVITTISTIALFQANLNVVLISTNSKRCGIFLEHERYKVDFLDDHSVVKLDEYNFFFAVFTA